MSKNNVIKNAKITKKETKEMPNAEKINNIKTLICAVLIIIIIAGGYLAYRYKDGKTSSSQKETKITYTEDEIKFKKEFESLNGEYENVTIIEDNNIKYTTPSEALEIIKDGKGLIFFGYAKSNESRKAIVSLLSAMSGTELETIYYVDIESIRDEYVLTNPKGTQTKLSKEGSKEYLEIVNILKDYLPNYTLKNDNDKEVNTGVKRITESTVVTTEDGQLKKVSTEIDEEEKLTEKYMDIISNLLSDSCPIDEPIKC